MSLPPAGPEPAKQTSLTGCHPELLKRGTSFIIECARNGLAVRVTEARRSAERQAWLYSIGRTASNPITGSDAILTKAPAGKSNHEEGRAFDIAPMRASKLGTPDYSPTTWYDTPFWPQIAAIGKACGLVWGGDFSTIHDKPHFELPAEVA